MGGGVYAQQGADSDLEGQGSYRRQGSGDGVGVLYVAQGTGYDLEE